MDFYNIACLILCYSSVGERFDMGKSTLSNCFFRVVKALNTLAPQIIKWPEPEDLEMIQQRFFNMAGINGIVGCIDGTFIPIKAPQRDAETYITRKCFHAVTMQAVCDPFLRFTDCFIGYPGSVSDSRIFRNSDFFLKVHRNRRLCFPDDQFIIGDKAYPILSWCLPPYIDRGNLTPARRNFNRKHAQTRQTIERAFALLFGRFRRLKYLDMNRHDFIPATVLAACVIHNLCINSDDLQVDDYIIEGRGAVNENEFFEHEHPNNRLINNIGELTGHRIRDELCRRLFEEAEDMID